MKHFLQWLTSFFPNTALQSNDLISKMYTVAFQKSALYASDSEYPESMTPPSYAFLQGAWAVIELAKEHDYNNLVAYTRIRKELDVLIGDIESVADDNSTSDQTSFMLKAVISQIHDRLDFLLAPAPDVMT